MLKRQASGSKATRKKRKGNATYSTSTLDSIENDKEAVENVRVWDISTSGNTGRMTASRKTLKHYYQVPLEALTTGVSPAGVEVVADVEDDGALADSEWPSGVVENERKKRKRIRATKENDSTKMGYWLQNHSSVFLDEDIRHDGLGNASGDPTLCPGCLESPGTYKCVDCDGGVMRCSTCTVSHHKELSLHRIKMWNGNFFETVSLESLGLVVDVGHPGGICPTGIVKRILVVDLSGYHYINARFCACPHTSFLEHFRQLLRFGWFPASTAKPKTAFTSDLLDMYHKLSLQGKLNLYDFYTTIMQKTDNCGHSKAKYRYHEISRCVRQWHHTKDLKRGL